jgi:hypothetical protein
MHQETTKFMHEFCMHQHAKRNPFSSSSMKVIKLNKNFGVYCFYENNKK